jgi:type I site-specific restriction endonuclease
LSPHDHAFDAYSEQDTADKLILPYLEKGFGFPSPASLDYQAQHMTALGDSSQGRYDGLYLHDGFPYAVLEAKRYKHDLTEADVLQARSYATSETFDYPVPFLIISNGREHRFLKRTETIDPADGKLRYAPIPATPWKAIKEAKPGEVRRLLGEKEL